MSLRELAAGSVRATLCAATITAAQSKVAQTTQVGIVPFKFLVMQAKFAYGSGGTSVDAYVQTSIDGGVTWFDVANFNFTTSSASKLSVVVLNPATPFVAGTAVATSGSLASNTVLNGILGDRVRVILTTVGTYGGSTTLTIDVVAKG